MTTLATVPAVRDVRWGPGQRREQRYLDFVVDGSALAPVLQKAGYDLISCLWLGDRPSITAGLSSLARLRGQEPGDAPGGRVAVYVCAECGNLGCGAVTVRVQVGPEAVEWLDWGYQTDYEDVVQEVATELPQPLSFPRAAYDEALATAAEQVTAGE